MSKFPIAMTMFLFCQEKIIQPLFRISESEGDVETPFSPTGPQSVTKTAVHFLRVLHFLFENTDSLLFI